MGFGAGLLVGGVIILGVVAFIVLGMLWLAGQAATALPKGVSPREIAIIIFVAAVSVGITKGLAVLEVVPEALVRTVTIEALLLVGAGGVAWLFTKEA